MCVIGEPKAGAWIGKDGSAKGQIEITADEVEFLSSGGGGRNEPTDADVPPAPEERKVSQLIPAGFTSTSIVSSMSGTTNTDAKLVIRLPCALYGLTRTRRCTPFSLFK